MKKGIIGRQIKLLLTALFFVLCEVFFGCSCKTAESLSFNQNIESVNEKKESLRITAWNVETFFDAKNDGIEYDEFRKSKIWGKEMYEVRLQRLAEVIKDLDSDVYIMEEIENEDVLQDLNNFLAGDWNFRKIYKYACFAKDKDSSIGCGVISRYPLGKMSIHAVKVKKIGLKMPSMRPVIKVSVFKGNRELVLLVNHWKSMSGGKEITEKWRDAQEAVLASLAEELVKEKKAFAAMGDFNRDIVDFAVPEEKWNDLYGRVLLRFGKGCVLSENGIAVISPWYKENGKLVEPGSYNFKGNWSRIDNMFFGGGAEFKDFTVETEGEWFDKENDKPFSYSLWNGKGYSDHLPISAVVLF